MGSIYMPVLMQPSNTAIDVTLSTNKFSCKIRGDRVISYKLNIKNNSDSSLVYNPAKVDLSTPLYNGDTLEFTLPNNVTTNLVNGQNYKFTLELYANNSYKNGVCGATPVTGQNTIKLAITDLTPNSTYANGSFWVLYNGQQLQITNYNPSTQIATVNGTWGAISGTDYTIVQMVQSPPVFFKARSLPIISFTNFPTSTVTENNLTLIGSYFQAENASLSTCYITYYDSNDTIIKRTAEADAYSLEMTLKVDGLVSGNTYKAGMVVTTEDGVVVEIEPTEFSVSYTVPEIKSGLVDATANTTHDSVVVGWQGINDIDGVSDPEEYYTIINDFIYSGGFGMRVFETNLTYNQIFALLKTYDQWFALGLQYNEVYFYKEYR